MWTLSARVDASMMGSLGWAHVRRFSQTKHERRVCAIILCRYVPEEDIDVVLLHEKGEMCQMRVVLQQELSGCFVFCTPKVVRGRVRDIQGCAGRCVPGGTLRHTDAQQWKQSTH
jgi:hypothetical protein